MYRDILTNKWVLGGVGFLIVLSVACVWWYQHDIADERKAAADAEELLRQSELSQKTDTDNEAEQAADVPADSETPTAEKPITDTTRDNETTNIETNTDNNIIADTTENVRMSPHGFGPYPEVPADYRAQCGPTSWQQVELYGLPPAIRGVELIERVTLKLWKEGDTQVRGGTLKNGKVYVNYPNHAYVRWTTVTDAEGNTIRVLSSWSSGGDLPKPTREQMHNGYIPPGVRVTDLDVEDPGIEPYAFLGLDK